MLGGEAEQSPWGGWMSSAARHGRLYSPPAHPLSIGYRHVRDLRPIHPLERSFRASIRQRGSYRPGRYPRRRFALEERPQRRSRPTGAHGPRTWRGRGPMGCPCDGGANAGRGVADVDPFGAQVRGGGNGRSRRPLRSTASDRRSKYDAPEQRHKLCIMRSDAPASRLVLGSLGKLAEWTGPHAGLTVSPARIRVRLSTTAAPSGTKRPSTASGPGGGWPEPD